MTITLCSSKYNSVSPATRFLDFEFAITIPTLLLYFKYGETNQFKELFVILSDGSTEGNPQ